LPKKENADMVRGEEKTKAPTPDKLDRSPREKPDKLSDRLGRKQKPYPLTEEEATPNSPSSEQKNSSKLPSKPILPDRPDSTLGAHNKKRSPRKTVSDYNKLVSHSKPR
jgi:hypothetical protein